MSTQFRPLVTHGASSYPNGLSLLGERSPLGEARDDHAAQQPCQVTTEVSRFTLNSALVYRSWYCFADQLGGSLCHQRAESVTKTDDGGHAWIFQ